MPSKRFDEPGVDLAVAGPDGLRANRSGGPARELGADINCIHPDGAANARVVIISVTVGKVMIAF